MQRIYTKWSPGNDLLFHDISDTNFTNPTISSHTQLNKKTQHGRIVNIRKGQHNAHS